MEIIKMLEEYLTKEEPGKPRDYFYVSEVGKSKKQIAESMKSPKSKKFDATVKRILDNGNYMHSRYYKYLAEMGCLVAAELTVVSNDLFHGRADAILSDKKDLWVLDLKSCSMWVFNKLTDGKFEDKLQLQMYMYFLNIPRGMLLYENKNDQQIKVFKYELDVKLVEKIIEEFKKLKEDMNKGIEIEDKPAILEDLQYGV